MQDENIDNNIDLVLDYTQQAIFKYDFRGSLYFFIYEFARIEDLVPPCDFINIEIHCN